MKIYHGITFTFNATATAGGVPLDLTGKVVVFNLRYPNSVTPYLRVMSNAVTARGSAIQVTDAANGKFTLTLTPAETAAMVSSKSRWYLTLEPGTRLFGRGEVTIDNA